MVIAYEKKVRDAEELCSGGVPARPPPSGGGATDKAGEGIVPPHQAAGGGGSCPTHIKDLPDLHDDYLVLNRIPDHSCDETTDF